MNFLLTSTIFLPPPLVMVLPKEDGLPNRYSSIMDLLIPHQPWDSQVADMHILYSKSEKSCEIYMKQNNIMKIAI